MFKIFFKKHEWGPFPNLLVFKMVFKNSDRYTKF